MQKNLFNDPAALLRSCIGVLYVAMGIALLVVPDLIEGLGKGFTTALAVVLLVYGTFRIYRAIFDKRSGENDM
ncbi:MAG: hypothetical protein R2794_03220 [Chitinophagales bacterium]